MKPWHFYTLCSVIVSLGSSMGHAVACLIFGVLGFASCVAEERKK